MPSSSDYILNKKRCATQQCTCSSTIHHEHVCIPPTNHVDPPSSICIPNVPPCPPAPCPPPQSCSLNVTNNIATDMEYFPVFSPTYNGDFVPTASNTKYMYNPANGNLMTHGIYVPADQTNINSITPIDARSSATLIHALKPVSYKINGQSPGPIHYGFVAQDVESAIAGQNLALIYHTRSHQSTIALDELIAPLIATVQTLSKTVDSLHERIEKLENTTYMCNRNKHCSSCSKE